VQNPAKKEERGGTQGDPPGEGKLRHWVHSAREGGLKGGSQARPWPTRGGEGLEGLTKPNRKILREERFKTKCCSSKKSKKNE